MDRLAIAKIQTLVVTTVGFSSKKTIECMDRLNVIHGEKVVVRIRSNLWIDWL